MPVAFVTSLSRTGLYRTGTFRPAETNPLRYTVSGGTISQQTGSR